MWNWWDGVMGLFVGSWRTGIIGFGRISLCDVTCLKRWSDGISR